MINPILFWRIRNLKMSQQEHFYVFLAGGLGNQLFQLCKAVEFAEGKRIKIRNLGASSYEGIPESLLLLKNWNVPLELDRAELGFLERKFLNLTLRITSLEDNFKSLIAVKMLTQVKDILRLGYQILTGIRLFSGIGVAGRGAPKRNISGIIGYFQSSNDFLHALTPSIRECLNEFSASKEFNLELTNFPSDNCWVVHVRLGDYRTETKFGLLNEDYYKKACDILREVDPGKTFVIFSNEPGEVDSMIPEWATQDALIMDKESKLNSIETLKLMSLGSGFVISNSTFGWWAGNLSILNNNLVVCPDPWFVNQAEPEGLVPREWIRINRLGKEKSEHHKKRH